MKRLHPETPVIRVVRSKDVFVLESRKKALR